MADYVSPGVYTREIDLSLYIPVISSSISGVVGTASRGPIDVPTLCTTWPQFVQIFGDAHPNYQMAFFAREFLDWGSQLWVTRVCEHDANGNFMATHSYVNVFGNTEYPVVSEDIGSVTSGNAGPYSGTFDSVPVVKGSIVIKDQPSQTPVVDEPSGQHHELGVTTYAFVLNHSPVVPGTLVI